MSDLFKILEDLAARARREESPTVDVSSRVVLRLRREAPTPAWPMVLVASSAAVAAVVVLSISLPLIEMLTDPLSAFFLMAANVLP
jgi:type VI protein secretion system component VasF